ncbi:MAG: sugar ABC transporter permease [Firmicutes bacterium]|nr:sugar ABC transporter permease [Bacillota bacterium]
MSISARYMPTSRKQYLKMAIPYLWLAPTFIVLSGILAYPWLWSLILSFYRWSPLLMTHPIWRGFGNFIDVLKDPAFVNAVRNSLILVGVSVPAQFAVGFFLAYLLSQEIKGRSIFLAMLTLPMMITPSIIGLMWKMLLSSEWGLVNYFLEILGLGKVGWLSDPSVTMWTIIMVHIWESTPFVILTMFAGLQSLPKEPYEAAVVDGANTWQSLIHITIPYLRPLIIVVFLFRMMFALRTFDIVYSLFRSGGPANAGMVLGVYLYESFRITWEIGRSSAISYILLFFTIILTISFTTRMYRGLEE